MERDVGNSGESYFEHLCHSIGIIPNKVQIDKTGWDYLIEFPIQLNDKKPIDLSGPTIRCYVQVKSTESGKKGSLVKVSNLKRFLDTNDPCFFIFIDFGIEDSPKKMFVTHFDEILMRKSLEKLRKISAAGDTQLNKKSLLVTRKVNDELDEINGSSLRSKLLSFVPLGMDRYRSWKRDLIKTLGYENHGQRADFFINTKDLDTLIDSSLNETFELQPKEFRVWDERFGIPIERNDLSGNIRRIILKRLTNEKHQVSFSSKRRTVWIEAEIFLPLFDKSGQPSKMRVFNEFLDLTLAFDSGRTHMNTLTDSKKKVDAVALENFGHFLCLLEEGGQVKFKIHHDSSFNLDMDFTNASLDPELTQFRDACFMLPRLIKSFKLPPKITFSPHEIFISRNKIVNAFNYLISGEYVLLMETELNKEIIRPKNIGMAVFFHFNIGGHSIGCKLRISGEVAKIKENRVGFKSKSIQVLEPGIFTKSDQLIDQIFSDLEDIENDMTTSGLEVIKAQEPFLGLVST